jgi:nitroreductase
MGQVNPSALRAFWSQGGAILLNERPEHRGDKEHDLTEHPFIKLPNYREYPVDEMRQRLAEFYLDLGGRRTVRDFSDRPVPRDIIEQALLAAGTAPSGANLQPWHFVVISGADSKRRIRQAAEVEEREFYQHRASPEWLAALEPLGTDQHKPFLENAPYLIAAFVQKYGRLEDGRKVKHYYPVESTGLACGMLITALHLAGLVCLTHTPSPMKFLNRILHRPVNERPFLLLVTGYPANDALVPDIQRKPLEDFVSFVDQ